MLFLRFDINRRFAGASTDVSTSTHSDHRLGATPRAVVLCISVSILFNSGKKKKNRFSVEFGIN